MQNHILYLSSYSDTWSQLIIFWEKWNICFEKKQKFYANPVYNTPAAGPALLYLHLQALEPSVSQTTHRKNLSHIPRQSVPCSKEKGIFSFK